MLDLPTRDLPTATRPLDGSAGLGAIARELRRDGFAIAAAAAMRRLVEAAGGRDWETFAASWDDLGPDRFMADGGTYRRRRFACFSVSGDGVRPKPPQPHFQSRDHNPLNGGVARIFDPVRDDIAGHPMNRALLGIGGALFAGGPLHAEMHQFRIEARPDALGEPTPEGLHRDGVDGVVMLMVRRENVAGGESTIADPDGHPLRRVTLEEPFDAAVVDDRRVFHGVSAVRPADPSRPALRDVLVLTFRTEET